jgi:ribonucleoside-diphosphate reductase alpha chain
LIPSLDYFDNDDLAAKVFVDKYALQNNEGDYLELTPKDMHHRLAKELARIENKYPNPMSEEEIFGLLDKFKYVVPQGSPMSGIGNPYILQSLGNCFAAGTKVLTINEGIKNIEDVKMGDVVPTHLNNYKKVIQIHKNKLDGRQLYNVKCFRTPKFEVTANHKFWSISKEQLEWNEKPQWNSIEYLRKGDFIAIPKIENGWKEYKLDLSEFVLKSEYFLHPISKDRNHEINVSFNYRLEILDEKIILISCWEPGKHSSGEKKHTPINRFINFDKDFAYFIGLWLGDGCIFSRDHDANILKGITFTFSYKEKQLIDFVSTFGEKCFGIKADINYNNVEKDSTVQIVFNSASIAQFINELFGRGCAGKKIPNFLFDADKEIIEYLIGGLISSDGTITKEGDVRIVLKNAQVITSLYYLSRRAGICLGKSSTFNGFHRLDFPKGSNLIRFSNKSYDDNRVELANLREESTLYTLVINGITYVKIDEKIKSNNIPEFVYTLGIEDDHSYSVEGVICQNCFTIDSPHDSYGGLLKTDQELAQLMKRRAGVGVDISTIRPKGMSTSNAAKTTDGIGIFMERFSNTCREVAQSGRRGAEILTLSVHHPEIETFLTIKRDLKKVTGANISSRFSNKFMNAVQNDSEYQQCWPVDSENPKIKKNVSAKYIWNTFIESNWLSAEPGVQFSDHIYDYSPADIYQTIHLKWKSTTSNPCSELSMGKDSCRLLLENLYSFVNDPFTSKAKFDFDKFSEVTIKAQRLMDDIIDLELECIEKIIEKIKSDPEPEDVKSIELNLWKEYKNTAIEGRRTGLGITALGDCLAALNLRYGSDESIKMAEEIHKTQTIAAYKCTCILAKERGTFPIFSHELEKDHIFLQRIWEASSEVYELYKKYGRRNIAITTIAPAGSVSMLTQTTSGIEPAFLLSYKRRKKINPDDKNAKIDFVDALGDSWQEFTVFHHGLKKWMEVTGKTNIEESPYWKATSADCDWKASVKLQGKIQKWICHSISKTCNVPNNASRELLSEIYMEAWKEGCKGFTVYRDGCRSGVLISSEEAKQQKQSRPEFISDVMAPKRPKELICDIQTVSYKGNKWTALVGLLKDKPYELFLGKSETLSLPSKLKIGKIVKIGKGKYDLHVDFQGEDLIFKDVIKTFDNQECAWATRMISTSLRHGVPIEFVADQLSKEGDITDFNKVISRILKKYIKEGDKVKTNEVCPQCSSSDLIYQEGCKSCKSCQWSRC